MSEWIEIKIDDLKAPEKGSIAMGPFGSRIKAENFVPTGIPVIKGGNLNGDFILEDKFSFLTEKKADELSSANAFRRDIVITHRGTIGQVGIIPDNSQFERYVVSQSQLKVSLNQTKTNPYFVYYFLRSPLGQNRLLQNASQVGVPAIAQASTSVKAILVPHPDKPIQDKIVQILLNLDHKIENNRRMNETLERMAQAIFKSWFVDFDPVHAKVEALKNGGSEDDARIAAMCAICGKSADTLAQLKSENPDDYAQLATTADAFPSSFTNSDLGQIPEGWEVKRTEDLSSKIAMRPFGSNIKVSTFFDSGVPIISGQHLHETLLNDGDNKFITPEHAEKLQNCNVFAMDLVFTHAGSIGQVALIPKDSEYKKYVISQRQFFLRPNLDKVSPAFLIYFFRSRNGQHILLSNASQVGVPSIARPSSHLKAIEVIVPTMDLMNSFEKKIDRIFALISQNRKQIQSLAETRDALLPKLLSGEIDVNNIKDKIKEAI